MAPEPPRHPPEVITTPADGLPHFSELKTARLRLRRFTHADLPTFLAYRNDLETGYFEGRAPITPEAATKFMDEMRTLEPGTPGEWFQIAIELESTGSHIGDIGFRARSSAPRTGRNWLSAGTGLSQAGVRSGGCQRRVGLCFHCIGDAPYYGDRRYTKPAIHPPVRKAWFPA